MSKSKLSFVYLALLVASCSPAISATLTGKYTFASPSGVLPPIPYIAGYGEGSYSFPSELVDNLADNAFTTVELPGLTSFQFSVTEYLVVGQNRQNRKIFFSFARNGRGNP